MSAFQIPRRASADQIADMLRRKSVSWPNGADIALGQFLARRDIGDDIERPPEDEARFLGSFEIIVNTSERLPRIPAVGDQSLELVRFEAECRIGAAIRARQREVFFD